MRYIKQYLMQDLQKKMVFVGGPRQCGKTTLALDILKSYKQNKQSGVYFNWDLDRDRRALLKHEWGENDRLVVFDELHKYPRWKNWLKGIYDTTKEFNRYLVTGSARLDVYRRGGDSLLGRYHYWRLHPFTLSEFPKPINTKEALHRLMTVGGFPEPFLDGNEREARRWRRERLDRVLKDDVRDLESIKNIQLLSLFVDELRSRVSSPIVLSNIAEDLQLSPVTLKKWLEILERMYLVFVVRPLTRNLPRAIQKPPKVYFFDNADVQGEEGAIFENLVATSLLKHLHFLEDRDGYRYELQYIRDKEKREVDFAIVKEGQVQELIEAKVSETTPSRALRYYAEKLDPLRARQVVLHAKRSMKKAKLEVVRAQDMLTLLNR